MRLKQLLKKYWLDSAIAVMVLVTGLYFANEYLWKPWQEEKHQIQLADDLVRYWAEEEEPSPIQGTTPSPTIGEGTTITETAEDGEAETAAEESTAPAPAVTAPKAIDFDAVVGLLRVPSWGTTYAAVIVEGVTDADLKKAVGHFPDSAAPGQIGNCALAAHRTEAGGLFHKLHKLEAGNTVVIETKTHIYVYELYGDMETVPNDAWEEVAPVPHQWESEPTEAYITLQGCEMNREGTKRVIWHGKLVEVREK